MSNPTPPSPAPAGRRGRRWLIALGVVAVLLVAIRVALPEVVRRVAESQGSKAMGRVVRLGNVDLELLAGRLVLDELVVAEPLGTTPPPDQLSDPPSLALSQGRADFQWTSLLDGQIHLANVELDGVSTYLKRLEDGSIVPILLPTPEPEGEPEPEEDTEASQEEDAEAEAEGEAEESAPWAIVLDQLTLRQVAARFADERHEATDIVTFGMEELSLGDLFVQGGDVQLGSVDLRKPDVRMQRELILAPPTTAAATAEEVAAEADPAAQPVAAEPAELPSVEVEEIAIEAAEFTLAAGDELLDVVMHLEARQLELSDPFPVKLRLTVAAHGASVETEGRLRLIPPFYDGTLRWASLDIPRLLSVAGVELPAAIESGKTDGELSVTFADEDPDAPVRIVTSGRIGLQSFSVTGLADATADVAFETLDVAIGEVAVPLDEPAATAVGLDSVALASPRIRYLRRASESAEPAAEGEVAATQATPAETAAAAPTGPRPSVAVGRIAISDGLVAVRDESLSELFETEIEELEVAASGVRWPELAASDIDVKAHGPGPTRTALTGNIGASDGNLVLDLQGLDLALLAPYLAEGPLGGVEGGSIALHTDAALKKELVDADVKLSIFDLATGESNPEFESAIGVPLDLAVALLRRNDGSIVLEPNVVVRQGETNLAPIVQEALATALRGAVAVPLKALTGAGGLLLAAVPGRDEPGQGLIPMEAGESAVPAAEVPSLARIASGLEKLPSMGIALAGSTGPDDDEEIFRSNAEKRAELAAERVEHVRDLLVTSYGVDPRRLQVTPVRDDEKPGVYLDLVPWSGSADETPSVAAEGDGAADTQAP